jgi:hypothetical protein
LSAQPLTPENCFEVRVLQEAGLGEKILASAEGVITGNSITVLEEDLAAIFKVLAEHPETEYLYADSTMMMSGTQMEDIHRLISPKLEREFCVKCGL